MDPGGDNMESLKQVIQTLASMIDAHKRVLELANDKKSILITGNLKELQTLLSHESAAVEELQQLEQQRIQWVAAYMGEKGVQGDSFTLEELLTNETAPAVRIALQSQAKELRSLVQKISELNQTNQQLIETSLSYVQYSIGMLVPKEQPIGYGPKGKNRYASLLDAKI
jgi:flagellar biosynthesis/type III secretory pathway chaperone